MDFRNVIFPARKRSACTRVFREYTRISNIKRTRKEKGRRGRKKKKEKRETIVKHLSFVLDPRPFWRRLDFARMRNPRRIFRTRSESGEASKLKPKLSIPILEDNLTGLCAFVPNSRIHTRDILPVNPMNRLNLACFFFFFFLMQAIFNS